MQIEREDEPIYCLKLILCKERIHCVCSELSRIELISQNEYIQNCRSSCLFEDQLTEELCVARVGNKFDGGKYRITVVFNECEHVISLCRTHYQGGRCRILIDFSEIEILEYSIQRILQVSSVRLRFHFYY